MGQVDDFQAGAEAVAQMEEAEAARVAALEADQLSEDPLDDTADRPRERRSVQLADIVDGDNHRPDEPEIFDLAMSIKERGLLTPPTLREKDGKLAVVYGHRRVAALRRLGWESIDDAIVFPDLADEEAEELMFVENEQRVALEPLVAARALRRIMARRKARSAAEVARTLGLPVSRVRKYLRLLEIPEELMQRVEDGDLSMSSADLLQKATKAKRIDTSKAVELGNKVADGDLSVGDMKKEVAPPKKKAPAEDGPTDESGFPIRELDLGTAREVPSLPADSPFAPAEEDFFPDPEIPRPQDNTPVTEVGPTRERPKAWSQLDAYLLGRALTDLASDEIRLSWGISDDAYAYAESLSAGDRAAKLRELAGDLLSADPDAPASLKDALGA